MFNFKLNISGVDYTEYLSYPFVLTEKNINDSLNTYDMQLVHTPIAAPIRPNQRAYVTIEENGVTKKQLFLLVVSDSVEKVGRAELYNHRISFIEFTDFLEQRILPDMTITRVQEEYEPTLKEVAEKILAVANIDISLSSATASILDAITSPE